MSEILFADTSSPGQIEILDSGAVRVLADIARTGVQDYSPFQFPESGIQNRPVRLFRPASEVFADASLATLPSSPVTIGHPSENVNTKNWKKLSVGTVEGNGTREVHDGEEFIRVALVLQDESAAEGVTGKNLREISQGYNGKIDWTAGITDSGAAYDGVIRSIRHNHTALLGAGKARAGQGARVLLDSNGSEPITPLGDTMSEEKGADLEKIRAEVRAEVQADLKDAADKEAEEQRIADEAEAAKAALEAERVAAATDAEKALADSKAETLHDVQDLLETREAVKRMLPGTFVTDGLTPKELKLAAIGEHMPKFDLKDSSDIRVSAAFDALKASATQYVVKTEVNTEIKDHATELQAIYDARVKVEG